MRAYMEGYTAAKREASEAVPKPYMTVDDIIAYYDGNIGKSKAYEIMRGVRSVCGGGKLGSDRVIALADFKYWESLVDKTTVRL
jgi:hypothetical protein